MNIVFNIVFYFLIPVVIGVVTGFTVESEIFVYIIIITYLAIVFGYIDKKR